MFLRVARCVRAAAQTTNDPRMCKVLVQQLGTLVAAGANMTMR